MDSNALNEVIINQIGALQNLLVLLEEQHDLLISNDVYKLEEIVSRIMLSNKAIAEHEVERRKITGGEPMKDLMEEADDSVLRDHFRSIVKLLEEVKTQKETNDMLIKMGLGYSTKMLNILSPSSPNSTTYNYRGNYRK